MRVRVLSYLQAGSILEKNEFSQLRIHSDRPSSLNMYASSSNSSDCSTGSPLVDICRARMAMKPTAKENAARPATPTSEEDHTGIMLDCFFGAGASKASAGSLASYLRPTNDGAQGSDGVVVILD